jgi:hypothetical protein
VSKYSDSGSLLWIRQFGTAWYDEAYSVSVDNAGSVLVGGCTTGSLGGGLKGGYDAFVTKFDTSGSLAWSRQLGTSANDYCLSATTDPGRNVIIGGYTDGALNGTNKGSFDAFVSKYDASGSPCWTRQFGTSGTEESFGVAADANANIVICGWTEGSLGGANQGSRDAFVRKYNASGDVVWTQQLGTSGSDEAHSVATDANGNVFVAGATQGNAFLSKLDASGSLLWTRQLGSSGLDECDSVAIDANGNAFVTGGTSGSLGQPVQGTDDAFLAKYDTSGNLLGLAQVGSSGSDHAWSVATDGSRRVYIAGQTNGAMDGQSSGTWNAFVVSFVVPEPSTIALLAIGVLGLLAHAWRRRKCN